MFCGYAMKIFLSIISMLSLSSLSVAQEANDPEIEEIIVIGELSRQGVRAQIIRVETDIYSFYIPYFFFHCFSIQSFI